MFIAEALVQIKDLKKEKTELVSTLDNMIYILDKENPESVEVVISDITDLQNQIDTLKLCVQEANIKNQISEKLFRIFQLKENELLYVKVASCIDNRQSRYFIKSRGLYDSGEAVELKPNFDATIDYKKLAKFARTGWRKLEAEVGKLNWQVTI